MPRPFLRARATLLTALLGMLLAPAQAADLFSLPEPPALPEEPVEWGDNWYLRADVGWQQITVPAITGDFASSFNKADLAMGAIGGGYQFNDWLRADVTIDRSVFRKSAAIGQLWCPYGVVGLTSQWTGNNIGILADPNETCTRAATASLVRTSLLANVYFDIVHIWGLTPYIGAGAGMTYNNSASSVGYFRNSDGAIWAPNLTLPSGQVAQWIYNHSGAGTDTNGEKYDIVYPFHTQVPFGPTNWSVSQNRSAWSFAWNVMAGVSYDISQNLKVDLSYRYLNAGTFTGLAAWGSTVVPVSGSITAQEVRLGVRVTTN
jgi:opacity protein-like surface antigen